MGTGNRYDCFDEYSARLIRKKAKELSRHSKFNESDRDDLEQELTISLLRRLPKFDPNRAKWTTFVARVVENLAATIVEKRKSEFRTYRRCALSLDDPVVDSEGEPTTRGVLISIDEYFRRTGKSTRSSAERNEMNTDIREFIENAPLKYRELCKRLMVDTVANISRETGIPRSTLYEIIKELRILLTSQEIKNYL